MRPPIRQTLGADLGSDGIGIRRNRIVGATQVDGARDGFQIAALHNIQDEIGMR